VGRQTKLVQNPLVGEINLTPMMDLTFILLITFMITFPLLESGLPVSLPKAEGDVLDQPDTVAVTVDAQGQWYVDDVAMNREGFAAEMAFLFRSRPEALFLLRGDEQLSYGTLVEVMQVMKTAGIRKISLVTQAGGGNGGA
jgi:biopolymer transport protein TolR